MKTRITPILIAFAVQVANSMCQITQQIPPIKFNDVIAESFKYWKNSNGGINEGDINRLMTNQSLTIYQSFAVSALKRFSFAEAGGKYYNILKTNYPTIERITNSIYSGDDINKRYILCYNNYLQLSYSIFADNSPSLKNIHQGAGGDCFLLSTIGAMVQRNPNSIKNMISQVPGGFRINFPVNNSVNYRMPSKSVFVTPPTIQEILTFNSASVKTYGYTSVSEGIWLPVLQKATATILSDTNKYPLPNYVFYDYPRENNPELMDYIFVGGSFDYMMALFTGNDVITDSITPGKYNDISAYKKKLNSELAFCKKNSRLTTLWMDKFKKYGTSTDISDADYNAIKGNYIYDWHCYAVLDFDSNSELVTLWNPFGDDNIVKGTQSLTHGYNMSNGIFSIPLDTIINSIQGAFCFERQLGDPNYIK
jgi:hypothetical protein